MINPNLLVVKPVGELTQVNNLESGSLLFYDGSNNMKRINADLFYQMLNNFARPIVPTDAGPFTANHWYKPTTSSADPGTNYPNAGNLKARNGYDTLFWYSGTTWTKTEVKFGGNSVTPTFESTNAVDPQGGLQIESRFGKTLTVLKYFLEQPTGVESLDLAYSLQQTNNSPIYGIDLQVNRILRANNTLVTYSESGTAFMVFQNIQLLQGNKKITRVVADIIPLGNSSGGTNASLVGIKSDGTAVALIMYPTTPGPTAIQHYDIDVSQYSSISIGLLISNGNPPANPNTLNQTIKFYSKLIDGDVNGVKKYVDAQITESSGRLNVKNEGAIGDGVTDDTAAINAAILKLVNRGGGELYFPGGVYLVSQIIVPAMADWQNIVLSGEFIPAQRFGTIVISSPAPDVTKYNGTVIKSLSTTANGVVRCNSLAGNFEGFSLGMLTVKNMTIRTYNNPQISGIDAWYIGQLYVENVMIDTGIYNVLASEPTKVVSGIVTPKNSNNAMTYLKNVCISGYYYGVLAYEHTNGDSLQIQSCKHALALEFASHASHFTRCCFQRNTNQVTVLGEHLFQIDQLNMEYAGAGQTDSNNAWQATQYELNDPNSKGIGNITYANVKGALGTVSTFRLNGGNKIIVKRIGNDTRVTTTIPSP